ncbi:HIT-like domain-containing protein [Glomus cerebriforme]|uniref:HIT-like domain-containing protein n=1 Tax=Glomus cerebriforme TaxID=658196 RepID=A0A397SY74_9GLOM|nr:HIT-like domain-containing protein [Glomus cerebriforme]
MGFFSCFSKDTPQDCVFCDLTYERVVYEDERIIVFHDIKPAAKMHLLIIPRDHIDTVNSLTPNDLPLWNQLLLEFGFQLPQTRMGFHIPPYNSVNHLHLHCFGLPFRNRFIGIKYTEWMPWYSSDKTILNSLSFTLNKTES